MDELVGILRELAGILRPLTSTEPGPLSHPERRHDWAGPEPFALAWWVKLLTIADLIELQGCSITAGQTRYLQTELFGGAGSLADLWFDVKTLGPRAEDVNSLLRERLKASRAIFGVSQ